MFKTLTPIFGIIVAIGVFFTYVQPTFREVKNIQDETATYAQATEKASELQRRISDLKQQQSSISLANLERLDALLPDRVNEVSVLIDLDALATTRHLILGDIGVGSDTGNTKGIKQVTKGADPVTKVSNQTLEEDQEAKIHDQYTILDISFSVSGSYDDFRLFLQDVERSLVLMEVTKISFTRSEGNATKFMMHLRLYSLNPPNNSPIS